jgi:hypothetical protein
VRALLRSPWPLWPALGWPALLGPGEHRLELLASHPGSITAAEAWARGLTARADDGSRFPLALRSVEAVEAPERDPRVARAVSVLRPVGVARVVLDAALLPAPAPPASARLFDLVDAGGELRPRSLARLRESRRVRIAFASDLHWAALWSDVHDALARFAPDLAEHALHPNRQVERLVDDVNARAGAGDLDALVLGGDLVDHVYRVSRQACAGGIEQTNLPGLLGALARLRVPCFAIPGNHDHRLHPWRPRAYGLAEIGVPPSRLPGLLRAAGLWDRLRLRPSDLDALRTREADDRDALAHHLAEVAPAGDFVVDLGALRLVLLSTGRDALCDATRTEPGRRRLLLRSLPSSWEHPDSEGLDDEQLAFLADALGGARGGAAVFLHAPLLQPRPGERLEHRLPRLDPGDDDGHPARTRFERALFATGLRRGVFFRSPAGFLRRLRAAPGPLAVFSGHVHRPAAWTWDPASGRIATGGDRRGVSFAIAPAVAHAPRGGAPGYLLAGFEGGELVSLDSLAP